MKIICIHKKQLIISFISIIILSFIIFYNYFSYSYINDDDFCAVSSDDIIVTELQEKLDNIYKSDEKIAYLTFDDGPTKIATPEILDILKNNDIKASFFVIGYRIKEFPQLVKREYEEGHFVANHGYSHENSKLYQSKNSFINEIFSTDAAISEAIGIDNYHSYIFRFPNGSKSSNYSYAKTKAKEYLQEINYAYIDWNALNNDSIKKYSSAELLNNLKESCKNKKSLVILMHDTCDVSKSYTSLDASIKFLKEEGYTFRTFKDFVY